MTPDRPRPIGPMRRSRFDVRSRRRGGFAFILLLLASVTFAEAPPKAPFPYVWGTAYHVLPGTHNNESGYFSLCEGLDGRIYVGTAKYGVNSYLVEFVAL